MLAWLGGKRRLLKEKKVRHHYRSVFAPPSSATKTAALQHNYQEIEQAVDTPTADSENQVSNKKPRATTIASTQAMQSKTSLDLLAITLARHHQEPWAGEYSVDGRDKDDGNEVVVDQRQQDEDASSAAASLQ